MKEYIDIEKWNRKQHFEHFRKFEDPYLGLIADVDVTHAFKYSKKTGESFFILYFFACMQAVNSIENLKYRIEAGKVVIYDVIDAGPTIARSDNTFGFSHVNFSEDYKEFKNNFLKEKNRIENSVELYSLVKTDAIVYCSALPWVNFSGHKDPKLNKEESVPKIGFGKFKEKEGRLQMPVSIKAHHSLVDGFHLGQFFKNYQSELNKFE